MERGKTVVITGCSSGVGYGLLKKFTKEGFKVFGSVRRNEVAEKLRKEIGELYVPLIFDITDIKAIQNSVKIVKNELNGKLLGGLINNAGALKIGPLLHTDLNDIKYLFDVITFGPLELMKAYLPLMGLQKNNIFPPAKIINISSNAGQFGAPFLGGYTGAKHGLEGITSCFRQELLKYGIKVIVVAPGTVNTSLADGITDIKSFEKTDYYYNVKKFADATVKLLENESHTIDEQASLIYKIFNTKNPKIFYSTAYKKYKNYYLLKIIPSSIRDKLFAKIFDINRSE